MSHSLALLHCLAFWLSRLDRSLLLVEIAGGCYSCSQEEDSQGPAYKGGAAPGKCHELLRDSNRKQLD